MLDTSMLDFSHLLTAAGILAALVSAFVADRAARAATEQAAAAREALSETREQTNLTRGALKEARTQNEVALHGRRLDILRALMVFDASVTAHGKHFKREAVWSLWEQAQFAEFYYPEEISISLDSITRIAIDIESKTQELSAPDSELTQSERVALLAAANSSLEQLRSAVSETTKLMRSGLQLV